MNLSTIVLLYQLACNLCFETTLATFSFFWIDLQIDVMTELLYEHYKTFITKEVQNR